MPTEYESFLDHALPAPEIILGQELFPLSIGHLLYLDRFGVLPALTPEKITLGILVCSRPLDDVIPTLQDPWLEWKIRAWHFRIKPIGKIDWTAKMLAFADYIDRGTQAPSIIQNTRDESASSDSGTPWLQHLKATLQSKLNYTPEEALNCAYTQAIWDYYTFHENEGNVKVCDRDYRREMKELADAQHDLVLAEARKYQAAKE